MTDVPHLAIPFRWEPDPEQAGQLTAAVVEQDELEDLGTQAEIVLRTPLEWRPELPEFGVPDLTFRRAPVDVEQVRPYVTRWVDAVLNVEESGDPVDDAHRRVTATVSREEES